METNSITAIKEPKTKGLPWGTKWEKNEKTENLTKNKKTPPQKIKERTKTKIIWEVKPKI